MDNLPANSNKSRLAERTSLVQETLTIEEKPVEREPVKSVVKGTAVRKKRGILSKFCNDIFAEDISNVGETVRKDFIIPMIKQGIFDTVTNALRLWLKVDGIPYNGVRSSIFSTNGVSRIAYSNQFDKARNTLFQTQQDPAVRRYLCDPVDGLTKQEAMDAVRQLDDIMSLFHMVRVADFYDTCGITPASTDHNYGWTDISDIRTTQLADGTWRITMPKPELLQTN